MRRQEKYPETSTFMYYNANPKNRITGDCWLRAICTGLEEDYNTVLRELVEIHLQTGYELSSSQAIEKYLTGKGWVKNKQPRKDDNTKYTGQEWCNHLSINDKDGSIGNMICNIGGHHMVAIKPTNHGDGFNCRYKVLDIWNSTDGCIGNYYTKIR